MFDLLAVSQSMTKGHQYFKKGVRHCILYPCKLHSQDLQSATASVNLYAGAKLCLSCTKWLSQILKTFTVIEGHQHTWILSSSAVFWSKHGCYTNCDIEETGCIKFCLFSFLFLTVTHFSCTKKKGTLKDYVNLNSFRNGSDACLSIKQTLNIWNGVA